MTREIPIQTTPSPASAAREVVAALERLTEAVRVYLDFPAGGKILEPPTDRRTQFENFLISTGLKRKEFLFELGWSWSKLCKYLRGVYSEGSQQDREIRHFYKHLQVSASFCKSEKGRQALNSKSDDTNAREVRRRRRRDPQASELQ